MLVQPYYFSVIRTAYFSRALPRTSDPHRDFYSLIIPRPTLGCVGVPFGVYEIQPTYGGPLAIFNFNA